MLVICHRVIIALSTARVDFISPVAKANGLRICTAQGGIDPSVIRRGAAFGTAEAYLMSEPRRMRPSELGHWLLMGNEKENLRSFLRTCPGDDELALEIANEGFFLGIFTTEQSELYARFLVDTGGLAIFRGLLLDYLNGRELAQAEFEFMDGALL